MSSDKTECFLSTKYFENTTKRDIYSEKYFADILTALFLAPTLQKQLGQKIFCTIYKNLLEDFKESSDKLLN